MNLQNRTIFCKDNLDVLAGINSNCIDLIYLDPPFNKKKIFSAPIGSSAAGASFRDIFYEEDVKEEWLQTIKEDNDKLHTFLESVKTIEGRTSYNFCYLAYMAVRLIEMHRVLKNTGSLYLHCDQTMSHYLKILMDIIFGEKNFRNEIVWSYNRFSRNVKKAFPSMNDTILFYSKSNREQIFNKLQTKPRDTKRIHMGYHTVVDNGKKKLLVYDRQKAEKRIEDAKKENIDVIFTQSKNPFIGNNWLDISIINPMSKERVGYPTQKPIALLERIISASSHEGDMVLDPFCGCATTCVASEKLGRRWVGVDVSVKAYELVKERLEKEVKRVETSGQTHIENWDKVITYSTTPPKRTDTNKDERLKKYVYVISHPNYSKANLYKVGIAKNLQSRLTSYQTGDPLREYKVAFSLLTPYFREVERHVHEVFDSDHEWIMGQLSDIKNAIQDYRPEEVV